MTDDPRTDDELLAVALAYDLDTDDIYTPYNEVMIAFYTRASAETLTRAQQLAHSMSARERRTGTHLLKVHIEALLHRWDETTHPATSPALLAEIGDTLFRMLDHEESTDVLDALATALGFLYPSGIRQPDIIAALDRLHTHPSADVRSSVAGAYSQVHDAAAVEPLMRLMTDDDADVRDWATFGLGSMQHADNPVIREALAARLTDEHPDVSGEALTGLAARGDARAVDVLLAFPYPITDDSTYQGMALVDAGRYTADPRLLPLLEHLAAGEHPSADLTAALDACRSGVPMEPEMRSADNVHPEE